MLRCIADVPGAVPVPAVGRPVGDKLFNRHDSRAILACRERADRPVVLAGSPGLPKDRAVSISRR